MDLDDLDAIAEKERAARKPVRIRCCTAAGCVSSGSARVIEELNAAIDRADLADRVEVAEVGCMRLCCEGPLAHVDPDGALYQRVRPEDAGSIVESPGLHPSIIGRSRRSGATLLRQADGDRPGEQRPDRARADRVVHRGGRISGPPPRPPRIVDSEGRIVADGLDGQRYRDFIGEATQHDNYLKFPYYKPRGYPDGIYRVGPLARLNLCDRMPTPMAERERLEYRDRFGTATSSFLYHYARLIEILAGVEGIARSLEDPDVLSADRLRAQAGVNNLEGVGVSEAPRGTLFHHYKVDPNGRLEWVKLVIATGQNGLAMNRTVRQIAQHYIKGPRIPEGVLNRLEAGIRAFDPCLSCSTHAVGMMALHVQLVDREGVVRDEAWKD